MAWRLEYTLPGGHRLFKKDDGPGFYIADDSGATPDLTDDGELWLDVTRPINVLGSYINVPVSDDENRAHVVGVTMADALYLSARFGWAIKADDRTYKIERGR
jgi:hypothetical protein